jgi:undecaprenyl-diphosphatase
MDIKNLYSWELRLDHQVFAYLNSWTHQNSFFDGLFVFLAVGLALLMAGLLVIYWFINKDRFNARRAVIFSVIALILSRYFFVEIIRSIWARNRPFIVDSTLNPLVELLKKGDEPGFPSGHSSAMFAIAMTVYFYNKPLGRVMFVLATLTGITRVVVGVHYPSDIIGGVVVGLAFAFLVQRKIAPKMGVFVKNVSDASDRFFSGR